MGMIAKFKNDQKFIKYTCIFRRDAYRFNNIYSLAVSYNNSGKGPFIRYKTSTVAIAIYPYLLNPVII